MTKNNRIGCYSRFGYEAPMENRLELIKEAGFSSTWISLSSDEALGKDKKVDLIPDLVRSKDLFLDSIHAPFMDYNKLWSRDKEERNDISNVLFSCISYCGAHNIPIVVIHITKGNDVPKPNMMGLNEIERLLDYAENQKVVIALENTRKIGHLEYIFSQIESPFLGLCYDSSHDFLYSPVPTQILQKWGDRLVATHFSDNDGLTDLHWPIGEGTVRWDLIKNNFPKKSYKGEITLEAFPKDPSKEDGRTYLKKSYERLKSLNLIYP